MSRGTSAMKELSLLVLLASCTPEITGIGVVSEITCTEHGCSARLEDKRFVKTDGPATRGQVICQYDRVFWRPCE